MPNRMVWAIKIPVKCLYRSTKIRVWLSKAKPVSPRGVYRNRIMKIPDYRKEGHVGKTGQRFSSELEDKDELRKVTLIGALAPKRKVTLKEAGGRQPP